MPKRNYSTKDFLLNEQFQQWVKFPTPERDAYWQHFLLLHPDAEQQMNEARMILEQLNFKVQIRNATTKARIKEKIDKAIKEQSLAVGKRDQPSESSLTKRLYPKVWMRIVATVSGLVLLASVYLMLKSSWEFTEYETTFGETRTIILPDQSVVTLNANSSLTLQDNGWSNVSARVVYLKGEAFFEVKKKKTPEGEPVKFVVHTGDVDIEVLGTEFNVRARHQETKVVLSSGSVKLNLEQKTDTKKTIMMEPGDLVAVSKVKGEVIRKVVNITHYTAWKENKLIFEHTPVAEIIQLIEDNYGLKVTVHSHSLLEKAFTGAAPADHLDILLDKMAVIYNLNIKRNEREVIITDKQ